MARQLLVILARIGLSAWLLVLCFVALASLVGHPAPFIIMAFVIAASPWCLLAARSRWVLLLALAAGTAAIPAWALADYGASEGVFREHGISRT